MKILVIHGPNLNMLGFREEKHYGSKTLEQINSMLLEIAKKNNIEVVFYQSNSEGKIIDFIQENSKQANGILINPAALTHYGYSLRDALTDTKLPIVEVHLSNILEREEFRKIDVLDGIVKERIMGIQEKSYTEGLQKLIESIKL